MLFSCSEEEVVKITDEKDFTELNNGVECINGDLYFSSSEDFYRIIDFIISSTDYEIKSWENSLGFVSFRTLRDSLEDEMDKISNIDNYKDFLLEHSDILYINDGRVLSTISDNIYSSIVGRNKVYNVGGAMNKIQGEYIYTSEDVDLHGICFDETMDYDKIERVSFMSNVKLKSTSCGTFQSQYLQKDRRRVFVETYLQYIYGGIYIPGESWIEAGKMMISIKVYGEKKNFWGNWKRYKTDLVFKSGSFDVYIPEAELGGGSLQESPIWSVENWNASSPSDMKEFSQHKWIYKYPNMIYPAEELLPSDLSGFYFEKSYVKATSRGVGYDNYAVINCGS